MPTLPRDLASSDCTGRAVSAPRVRREDARAASGFSLVELVIVIAIVAVLAVIAFPSFSAVIRSNRVSTQSNDLLTAMNLARTEAVTRGARVSVCASASGTACDAPSWASGWIVFTDSGVVGNLAGTDEVIRMWPAIKAGDLLNGSEAVVSFGRDGALTTAADMAWTFKPDGCTNDQRRVLRLRGLGRAEIARESCA